MARKGSQVSADPYGLLGQVPSLAASSLQCGACGQTVYGTCDQVDGLYCCLACRVTLVRGAPFSNLHLVSVAVAGLVAAVLLAYVWLRLRIITNLELTFMPLIIGELIGRLMKLLARRRRSPVVPILAGCLTYTSVALVRFVGLLINRLPVLSLPELDQLTQGDWEQLVTKAFTAPIAPGPSVVPALVLLVVGVAEAVRITHRRPKVVGPLYIDQLVQQLR